jgi:hypothetical protein
MIDNDLEPTLARLRPAAPSPELMARLQRALSSSNQRAPLSPVSSRSPRVLVIASALIAAALVTVVAIVIPERSDPGPQSAAIELPRQTPPAPLLEVFAPIEARNYLLDAKPAAVVEVPNHPPIRLLRCLWLDDVLCRNERGDAALEVLEAREQWVPVTAQVY